jgi:broad specificity phosphatase PhoE
MVSDRQQLFLVRHGQTALNAEGRLRGLADPPLDAVGIAEARAVAAALANRGIRVVYASPLERAAHTGRILAAGAGAVFHADNRFNDRDYGPWTGTVRADVVAEFGSVDAAPGVEPASEVLDRVRPALDAVLEAHPGDAVAVVTHDAVIRPLLAALDAQHPGVAVPTGSWAELERENGRWRILSVDNTP